jgi:hypothetical protein
MIPLVHWDLTAEERKRMHECWMNAAWEENAARDARYALALMEQAQTDPTGRPPIDWLALNRECSE